MVSTLSSILRSSLLSASLFITFSSFVSIAQDATPTPNPATPLVAEGIPDGESITIDKKRRGPVVSIGTEVVSTSGSSSQVKILADAFVPAEEYKNYPIEFKFFVNGLLRETQIRTVQLPRPVGIVVGTDIATPPFNWTIVATLLHPNRQFVTVAQGAVFGRDLGRTYDCSLTLSSVASGDSSSSVYVADGVSAGQVSNSDITLNFMTSLLDDGTETNELVAAASLSFRGTSATGSLTTTVDGRSVTTAVSGTTTGDGTVETINVQSSDGLTKLECD